MSRNNKPSISQLLDLLNKPALLSWANKLGLDGIKLSDYRKKVTTQGTSLHNQIKNYILDEIPFQNIEIQKCFENFISDKEVIDIEKDIETDLFVGRFDIKLKFSNQIYICDFKTSNDIYLETKLQLVAYRMAEKVDKLAVIKIPSFEFKDLQIDNYQPYEDIIECLSIIYLNKKHIENGFRNI